MLKLENCRERQKRLLAHMANAGLEYAVIGNPKTVYYLTGALVDAARPHAFLLAASGRSLLVTIAEPAQHCAERVEVYTGYSLERHFGRVTWTTEVAEAVRGFIAAGAAPAGVELEFVCASVAQALARPLVNLTPALEHMRRCKDPDELDCLRAAIRLTEAGYAAIKARLAPGMTELEAYRLIEEAMMSAAGTAVDLRGDFACGVRAVGGGGAPTARRVEPGDTYILDLFPAYQGYQCDLCRTFVAGRPSPLQQDAWAHVVEGHTIAQRVIRPGTRARQVDGEIREHLERFAPARGSFTHHAGHGLGLDAWEDPWLTPGSEHVIQEGDVVAVEPGLYSTGMQGGIRLEHNYLVTAAGVVALDEFPLDLV